MNIWPYIACYKVKLLTLKCVEHELGLYQLNQRTKAIIFFHKNNISVIDVCLCIYDVLNKEIAAISGHMSNVTEYIVCSRNTCLLLFAVSIIFPQCMYGML